VGLAAPRYSVRQQRKIITVQALTQLLPNRLEDVAVATCLLKDPIELVLPFSVFVTVYCDVEPIAIAAQKRLFLRWVCFAAIGSHSYVNLERLCMPVDRTKRVSDGVVHSKIFVSYN